MSKESLNLGLDEFREHLYTYRKIVVYLVLAMGLGGCSKKDEVQYNFPHKFNKNLTANEVMERSRVYYLQIGGYSLKIEVNSSDSLIREMSKHEILEIVLEYLIKEGCIELYNPYYTERMSWDYVEFILDIYNIADRKFTLQDLLNNVPVLFASNVGLTIETHSKGGYGIKFHNSSRVYLVGYGSGSDNSIPSKKLNTLLEKRRNIKTLVAKFYNPDYILTAGLNSSHERFYIYDILRLIEKNLYDDEINIKDDSDGKNIQIKIRASDGFYIEVYDRKNFYYLYLTSTGISYGKNPYLNRESDPSPLINILNILDSYL